MNSKLVAATLGVICLMLIIFEKDAYAVPSFARKYQTSCQTCHTVYPVLNSFGEAFRRNGYRFPSQNGSLDSDSIKSPTIALGQEEYEKTFPNSVLPDKIMEAVPLSVMVNGGVSYNIPGSDAHDAAGNAFTWNGVVKEFHVFGAGAFTDKITYFSQLTIADDSSVDLETGYVLFNDLVGPDHLANLWVGRLMNPQLTSYGLHSSYLNDTFMPAVSLAGLYNPGASFTLGQGHSDGVEVNGVIAHRIGYSVGWIASMANTGSGLKLPTAEDVYAHVGAKLGGMSLDGEGPNSQVADPMKPWSEYSITLDAFAYHGMTVMDNGTNAPSVSGQNSAINALGSAVRANLGSLVVNAGAQVEQHAHPYMGTAPTAATDQAPAQTGTADMTTGRGVTAFSEVNYVVYPWLVPGVRLEHSNLSIEGADNAELTRVIPGAAILIRPNIKVVAAADFERATGLPPAGNWSAAGGAIVSPASGYSKLEAEQVNVNFAWAF